jgi:hypothetical protein
MSKARTTQQQVPTEYTYVLDDVTLMYGHSSFQVCEALEHLSSCVNLQLHRSLVFTNIDLPMQGARDYQEDTVAHVASQAGLAAGVFDGHGGDEVSKVRLTAKHQSKTSCISCSREAASTAGRHGSHTQGAPPVVLQPWCSVRQQWAWCCGCRNLSVCCSRTSTARLQTLSHGHPMTCQPYR